VLVSLKHAVDWQIVVSSALVCGNTVLTCDMVSCGACHDEQLCVYQNRTDELALRRCSTIQAYTDRISNHIGFVNRAICWLFVHKHPSFEPLRPARRLFAIRINIQMIFGHMRYKKQLFCM
jgi:hypothetical protein